MPPKMLPRRNRIQSVVRRTILLSPNVVGNILGKLPRLGGVAHPFGTTLFRGTITQHRLVERRTQKLADRTIGGRNRVYMRGGNSLGAKTGTT